MVKIMENPIKNGWFGGVKTPIFGNTQMDRRLIPLAATKLQERIETAEKCCITEPRKLTKGNNGLFNVHF